MAQNYYEGLYILDSNKFARDPDAAVRQITDVLNEFGAEILISRIWEERRLAYPIKKQRRGTYWLVYFKCDSLKMEEIRRRLQLAPDILRFMHIKIDPRIIDVLVEHARGNQVALRTVREEDLVVDEDIHDEDEVEEAEDVDVVED